MTLDTLASTTTSPSCVAGAPTRPGRGHAARPTPHGRRRPEGSGAAGAGWLLAAAGTSSAVVTLLTTAAAQPALAGAAAPATAAATTGVVALLAGGVGAHLARDHARSASAHRLLRRSGRSAAAAAVTAAVALCLGPAAPVPHVVAGAVVWALLGWTASCLLAAHRAQGPSRRRRRLVAAGLLAGASGPLASGVLAAHLTAAAAGPGAAAHGAQVATLLVVPLSLCLTALGASGEAARRGRRTGSARR